MKIISKLYLDVYKKQLNFDVAKALSSLLQTIKTISDFNFYTTIAVVSS